MKPLDPVTSLALSLRANPGVYALVLGSGASRAAGIPTGWEVVLDLVRRVAVAQGVDPGEHPDQWYSQTYGREAGYSDLLDELCRTPTERQQLLKGYFEPTEEERDQHAKLPTAAHHAIAELMELGLVRVVVTTNFDRLLERALEQRGITPTVVASPDQALGMIPLVHQRHCIVKLHGDYLDTRILNTQDELSAYDPVMTALADRIFDEFGLIVCGWSATWDPALRRSIERTPTRRYSCFWTSIGPPTGVAQSVARHRGAIEVEIASADRFLEDVLSAVRALEDFDRPHPLSTQAAVGAAKRWLADDAHRIRLHDLYRGAFDEARAIWSGPLFPPHGPIAPNTTTASERIKAYDASTATLTVLNATIGRWSRGGQDALLADAIGDASRAAPGDVAQFTAWSGMRGYPATRMLYAAGMAALVADRPALLSALLSAQCPRTNGGNATAATSLVASHVGQKELLWGLFGGERRHVPASDWLHETLRDPIRPHVGSDADYDVLFDTFEYYHAVAYRAAGASASGWSPVGAWGAYRHKNHDAILAGLKGGNPRYGGRTFAGACPAMIGVGRSLDQNVEEVEAFMRTIHFH